MYHRCIPSLQKWIELLNKKIWDEILKDPKDKSFFYDKSAIFKERVLKV